MPFELHLFSCFLFELNWLKQSKRVQIIEFTWCLVYCDLGAMRRENSNTFHIFSYYLHQFFSSLLPLLLSVHRLGCHNSSITGKILNRFTSWVLCFTWGEKKWAGYNMFYASMRRYWQLYETNGSIDLDLSLLSRIFNRVSRGIHTMQTQFHRLLAFWVKSNVW